MLSYQCELMVFLDMKNIFQLDSPSCYKPNVQIVMNKYVKRA
jgi:hypothetical protein